MGLGGSGTEERIKRRLLAKRAKHDGRIMRNAWETETYTKFCLRYLKERDELDDTNIDRKITVK